MQGILKEFNSYDNPLDKAKFKLALGRQNASYINYNQHLYENR